MTDLPVSREVERTLHQILERNAVSVDEALGILTVLNAACALITAQLSAHYIFVEEPDEEEGRVVRLTTRVEP